MRSPTIALIVLAALLALGLAGYALIMFRRLRAARAWRPVPGVVTRAWLAEVRVPGAEAVPAWQLRVNFDYTCDGATRTGSEICPDPGAYRFSSPPQAQRHLARWRPGAAVTVHVAEDGRAVLSTEVDSERRSHYLATGLGGVLVLACVAWLAWAVA